MKKYWPVIAILAVIKLIIHLVGNQNYGFHRDELLHLSVSEHPAWGYMEFPPFISWIGSLSHLLFGYSLPGIRIFATIAGLIILLLCCLIAKEFGGQRNAVLLAGTSILAFLPFYRNHMLFQPVAFDQLFWTLCFYLLIKFINSGNKKFLIFLGIAAGFGLHNKYTFLVWLFASLVGLLFYERARLFMNRWLYIAGLIAFLLFLPNIIWQINHDLPFLLHMQKLKESQLDENGPFDFVSDQAEFLLTFIVAIIGIVAFFIDTNIRRYRSIGISVLIIFGIMWALQSKAYYFFGAYPILFAAGAVKIEKWTSPYPKMAYAIAAVLMIPVFFYLPKAIPILPIDNHIAYEDLKPDASGHFELSADYADMFGWEQQALLVAKAYSTLSAADKKQCIILAGNYGEAGAIKILGDKYGLPDPACTVGSFWLWGPAKQSGDVCITIGVDPKIVEQIFQEHRLLRVITHPYAIEEENNIALYICRKPRVSLEKIWPTLEKNVFD